MKKVLLVIPYGSVGGMERLALYFYGHYKKKGIKVLVVKFFSLGNDIIYFGNDEIALSKIDLHEMSVLKRLSFYLSCPLRLHRIVKKNGITHTISFGDMANLFSSLSFSKEFKVGSIHALKSSEFAHTNIFNKIFRISYKSSYIFLDKVVCISKGIKDDLIDNCGFKFKRKLKVIYNPHDIENIRSLGNEKIEIDSEVDIFKSDVLLFVGRLSLQKAPWHLVRAFNIIKDDYPNSKLVFIGDGSDEISKYLKLLIQKYKIVNKVFFLGRKKNPYKYIKRAKLLCLSSYYEGTPNVIVEAMSLRVPIISTNCTEGVGELMSGNRIKNSDDIIKTAVGYITPNIFKGKLDIPPMSELIQEDEKLSQAMALVLEGQGFYGQNSNVLLDKFNLDSVAEEYLKN